MKISGFTKKRKTSITLTLLSLLIILILTACGKNEQPNTDAPTLVPVETTEATAPPTESVDYSADEAETIKSTVSRE